jgi:hypothetical protein
MSELKRFDTDGYPDAKDTGDYLILDENGTYFVGYWHDEKMNYPRGRVDLGRMTYWMPLPEPPKPEGPFRISDCCRATHSHLVVGNGDSAKSKRVGLYRLEAEELRDWLNEIWIGKRDECAS